MFSFQYSHSHIHRNAGIRSPVTQNPYINIGSTNNKPLRLAINTAQFGRTFQDRSHIIRLLPRSLITHEDSQTCDIYNLNVRGKRGNIVQVYPSVEYDFFPNRLTIRDDDCLHIQWTGMVTMTTCHVTFVWSITFVYRLQYTQQC